MVVRFFILILTCSVATSANSESVRLNYFVNCTSAQLDLTFEINTFFRTVRNVNYNTVMDVAHWSEEEINTTFSIKKSMSQLVSGAQETDNISVNFNRLKGVVSVAGIIEPNKEQIIQCKSERNWGCDDWYVTEIHTAQCSIVEQKF